MAEVEEFWRWLESTELAFQIGATYWFPLLESVHVLAMGLMVGCLVSVDLRLMGLSGKLYPASVVSRDLMPWIWTSFGIALITGSGMFITRPSAYAVNPAFLAKLCLLALAGLNASVFQFRIYRTVEKWDASFPTPTAARIGGGLSLVLWVGVILAGRWTGHIN